MNTQDRAQILSKFYIHLQKKSLLVSRRKSTTSQIIETVNQMRKDMPHLDLPLQFQPHPSQNQETAPNKMHQTQIQSKYQSLQQNKFLSNLIEHQSHITNTIQTTHSKISKVLKQITSLRNRKQNTERLLDCMTSIFELKRLAYGFWSGDQQVNDIQQCEEVLRNLVSFYEVKNKSYYCEGLIQMIEINIKDIESKFKQMFDKQLGKSGNQSQAKADRYGNNIISVVAKVLETIAKNSKLEKTHQMVMSKQGANSNQNKSEPVSTHRQLCRFYKDLIKKEFTHIEDELFKIPIVGNNIESVYIFFDLAKNVMKTVVTLITTYRTNIIRVSSLQGLAEMIVQIFNYTLETVILQILRRQKKYFQIDKITIDPKKLSIKDSDFHRLTQYFNQFNAIWNQIERLRYHLEQQISEEELKQVHCNEPQQFIQSFIMKLQNTINGESYIQFNSNIILYMQAYQRHQFDKLLRKSPFVNSLWQQDPDFFKPYQNLVNKYSSGEMPIDNKFRQCTQGLDFVEQSINLFQKGLQKSFETLNVLIVSALINFTNHNLLHEDMFYAFNQMFNRLMAKIPNKADSAQYLIRPTIGILILLNVLTSIPNALKNFLKIQIPEELPNYDRVKIQLTQLVNNNQDKARDFLSNLVQKMVAKQSQLLASQIVHSSSVSQINETNFYKKMISKWENLLEPSVYQILVKKFSNMHAGLLEQKYFSFDSNSVKQRKYNQSTAMSLQKQIRNILNFYDSKTSKSNLAQFKKILTFVEVLLAQSQQQFDQLFQSLKGKYSQNQLKGVWNMKLNR